jgi:hypothetical protein
MGGVRAVAGTDAPPGAVRGTSLAWLAGPLSTGLGLAAHVAAGGQAPGILIIAALAALLGMVAAMAGRRPLPGWAVLVAAGLAQQLLHLAFASFSTASGFSLPGHHSASPPAPPVPGVSAPEASGASHSLHLMLHLHMAAALVVMVTVTQWRKVVSVVQRRGGSGRERAPGNTDA